LVIDYNGNVTPNNLQASGSGPHWFSSGNVGIGTTNPSAKLDVVGDIQFGAGAYKGRAYSISSGLSPNPGSSAFGGIIEGSNMGHLLFDLKNNDVQDSIAFRYSSDNSTTINAIGMVMKGNGSVGIGTTAPAAMFSIGSSSQFRVDSTGNLTRIRNVAYSWPSAQGSANTVLTNNGSGTLTWSAVPGDGWGSDVVVSDTTLTGNGTSGSPLGINLAANLNWTGIHRHSNDFYFGGNTGILASNGNVGINTTNPPNERLDVVGNIIANKFIDQTGGGDWFLDPGAATSMQVAGKVGIGTTSPAQKLHVEGQCITGDSELYTVPADSPASQELQVSSSKLQEGVGNNSEHGTWNSELTGEASNSEHGTWNSELTGEASNPEHGTWNSELTGEASNSELTDEASNLEPGTWNSELTGEASNSELTGEASNPELTGEASSKFQVKKQKIKDIQPGTQVYSLNKETGKLEPQRVNALLDMGVKPVFKIETESGKTITTTANHPYLVNLSDDIYQSRLQSRDAQSVAEEYGISQEYLSTEYEFSQTRAIWVDRSDQESSYLDSFEHSRGQWQGIEKGVHSVSQSSQGQSERSGNLLADSRESGVHKEQANKTNTQGGIPAAQHDLGIDEELKTAQWIKVQYLSPGDRIATTSLVSSSKIQVSGNNSNTELGTGNLEQYVMWDKIQSIEFVGYEQVYDIEVENTHNFVANGILAHNTYLSDNVEIGTTSPGAKVHIDFG
ncbi:MAG: hypothetical protein XD95_0722, partial [Microgenomates bacterium 39_7]